MASTAKLPRTTAALVGSVASTLCISQNLTRASLFVFNPGSVAVFISADDIAAQVNGAGSILLNPGVGIELDGWTAGLNAIAQSGSNNPLTIHEYS